MGLIETFTNLKDYDAFEIKSYQLQRSEANECIQALEKQIPRKAKIEAEGEKTISGFCPRCEVPLVYIKAGYNPSMKSFCNKCGQRIDWA